MFKFLKNLFKEELTKEDVKLENLEQWLDNKSKPFFEDLRQFAKENINEFNILLNQLTEQIKELEYAEVNEKEKIEDRVKSIVQGHRTNYIRRLNLFQRNITLPENLEYETILDFLNKLESELNSLSKETTKSFYAVQHLFHKQAEEIAKIIAKISSLRDQFIKNIEDKKLIKLIELKKQIKELNNLIKKQKDLNIQFEEEKNKLLEIERLRKINQDKLEELKQGNKYLELRSFKGDLIDNENKTNELKNQILSLFAPLEAGLRKYERITLDHIGLLRAYIDDAVIALLGDRELKILEISEKFKQSIEKGSIDLKDKKKDKTIEAIDKINREVLESIFSQYEQLANKRSEIEKKIGNNDSLEKEKDISYKIEHFNESLKRANKLIEEINHNLERIDIDKEKDDIRNSVKDILRIEIDIA